MRETRVRPLGLEDPLEKEMAIHSGTIAWKIPWTEVPGGLQSVGSQRVRATTLSHFSKSRVPNPQAMDWYCSVAIRNQAAQQEVSSMQESKASSVFIATPHCSSYCPSSSSYKVSGALESPKSTNPPVNWDVRDLLSGLLMRIILKPSPYPGPWKTCLHETDTWCQNNCGPLS